MSVEDRATDDGRAEPAPEEGGGPLAQPWLLVACLCAVAAAASLLLGYFDAAFVIGALGAVSWFLNVRAKLLRKVRAESPPEESDEEDDADEEAEEINRG